MTMILGAASASLNTQLKCDNKNVMVQKLAQTITQEFWVVQPKIHYDLKIFPFVPCSAHPLNSCVCVC